MFAKIKGTEVLLYPYTKTNLQEENPYTNFGLVDDSNIEELYSKTEDAINNGSSLVSVVVDTPPDYIPENKKVVQSPPELKDGVWKVGYVLRDLTGSELEEATKIAAQNVVGKARQNIVEYSWTQSEGSGLTAEKRAEWAAYLAKLTTIDKSPGFPFSHEFPTKPQ